MTQAEIAIGIKEKALCPNCASIINDDTMMYLVNSEGVYGMPEYWACHHCMKNAENGSKMADLRGGIYSEDFAS